MKKLSKISTKTLVIVAMLTALASVLKAFSFSTGVYRISLFDVPLILAGIIGGPLLGGLAGLMADVIYGVFFSSFPFSFLMALSSTLWGVCGGLLYKKEFKFYKLLILILATAFLTTAFNSIYLYIYIKGAMWLGLPKRIITLFIKWPISTAIVSILYSRVIIPSYYRKSGDKIEIKNICKKLKHKKRTII